jgi:Mrp family chromosome partitioning ATPase
VELERQSASLRRQIEARRAALGQLPDRGPNASRGLSDDAAEIVELETEWHHHRSELDRARQALQTIQQTARSADLSADAVAKQGHAEMTILEPAYLPTRPDRGRGRVFFIGAAIVLFLALAYASARVLADDTILDEGDIVALDAPQVLAAVPHFDVMAPPPEARAIIPAVHREEDIEGDDDPPLAASSASSVPSQHGMVVVGERGIVEAVFEDPDVEVIGAHPPPEGDPCLAPASPRALAALRVLRHRLEQRRGDGSYVVAVMSPSYTEGKTTLAVRLARTLSEADRARVVLVEGNFERPRLAASLGLSLPPEAGFSAQIWDRMRGRAAPWGVVRLGTSLSILAEPGEVAAHPETIHSTHLETALVALRRSYEYVVVDGPAVMGAGDANVLEAAADGVLLLVRAGSTQGAALSRATRLLGEGKILGVVLNDVVEERPLRSPA